MIGSSQRPLRVAIVGSGPSGFYAAEALLNSGREVLVDIFDRLPSPFGLVRYGVAPDHAKIRNIINIYERIAMDPRVAFFGNVTIGKHISTETLRTFYDAVIFACGAESDRPLNIPGEELDGSHTATEFVGWYNGHPDYRHRCFDLSQRAAVIIGLGNVAMDVARILCKTVDELKHTDIARHALEALAQSQIREVYVVGRRGPVQAAFTPNELREFAELADCEPVVDPRYLKLNPVSQEELHDPAKLRLRKNFEILQEFAARTPHPAKRRRVHFHFLKSPLAIFGGPRVQNILFERKKLRGAAGAQSADETNEVIDLSCGLVFRSVGYRGVPIQGVPFDAAKGIFPNKDGRIIQEDGRAVPGWYAVGWIKRGPSGVIGTNKPDSQATVAALLEDVPQWTPCPRARREDILEHLQRNRILYIDFKDWKKIDVCEMARGQEAGKPREKITAVDEMLRAAGKGGGDCDTEGSSEL